MWALGAVRVLSALFRCFQDMEDVKQLLAEYARRYETPDFLPADPSCFMHKADGDLNRETLAFIASCLSYGSRKQFFPKIQYVLDCAHGEVYDWVVTGNFSADIPDDDSRCYYRLYTFHTMNRFLHALRDMLLEHGSIGRFVERNATDGYSAVVAICGYFASKDIEVIIPKDTKSACKRVCMFLRWMVRDGSPVDLGLWGHFIDKRTLIMPMDTHVVQEAVRLGLLSSKAASMSAARKLTSKMAEIFPDDPLKGDFALFGYGVNH